MTDLRTLVARMADELDHYRQLLMDDRRETHALAIEARAALAEPQPPADGEVAELVTWLHGQDGGLERRAIHSRIANLLERLEPPGCLVLKPSPELIEAFQEGLKEPGVFVPLQPGEHLAASAWQPISTAPRDGTEILASDLDCIDIVSWDRPFDDASGWSNRDGDELWPCHWQPLPDHPEVE